MKARELLPQTAYDFYAGGANDEITLRENRLAYERITLLPRMLVDVSERHLARPISCGPAQTGRSCQQTKAPWGWRIRHGTYMRRILPGFIMLSGSIALLIARITLIASTSQTFKRAECGSERAVSKARSLESLGPSQVELVRVLLTPARRTRAPGQAFLPGEGGAAREPQCADREAATAYISAPTKGT